MPANCSFHLPTVQTFRQTVKLPISKHILFNLVTPGLKSVVCISNNMFKLDHGSTTFFFSFLSRYVLQWWLFCALTEQCISPTGAQLKCDSHKLRNKQYGECHRFDQSALSILMANRYQGHKKSRDLRDKMALDDTGEFIAVKRGEVPWERPLFRGSIGIHYFHNVAWVSWIKSLMKMTIHLAVSITLHTIWTNQNKR